ncbi:low affinity iron permease family protein [Paraflavitalea sp. CAU 1676]|uniref:low affinity iron permease family protein n=1 Tax=Paraflavitalea sp. CAU 1676 TaxID=3032598 RepID=UPI0023DA603F|nr:low affinity iron permease family protein [Paraflavitalea sp. CAU 1676]MDF2191678.1 low affinity iron permease family protein [Paraflavitalea sp. CAU 1676]
MATKRSRANKDLKTARLFNKISAKLTHASGSPLASILALALIVGWAISGPLFGFSDTWQLVINTTTTIITFLMVFIIQQTQNKDTIAIHMKLNELIACHEKASNRLVDIEDLTEEELNVIKKYYTKLSRLAEKEKDLHSSHSLDEADENHEQKSKSTKKGLHA